MSDADEINDNDIGRVRLSPPRNILIAVLLGVILFLLSSYRICDPDLWMYINTGELIARDLQLPLRDVYSYTRFGEEWINHSWLSQLIFFLFYRVFRIGGLYMARYLTLGAIFFFVFRSIRDKIGWTGAVWLTLVSILATGQRFVIRPELFTFLFLSLIIFILEKSRFGKSTCLVALPFIFLAWANLHGGFIIGLAVLLIYCLGEGIMIIIHLPRPPASSLRYDSRNPPGRQWLALLLVFLVSAAAAMLNPNGLRAFFYSFHIGKLSRFIYVWQPFPLTDFTAWSLSQYFFPALILVSAVSFLFNRKKIYWPHLLVFLSFSYLGLKAGRNIFLFAIVAPTILAQNLLSFSWVRTASSRLRPVTPVLLLLVVAATITCPRLESDPFSEDIHRQFGWGVSSTAYPRQCADFIERNRIEGPIFNSFGIGSYLIRALGPAGKVYVDGRLSVYDIPFLLDYNRLLVEPSRFAAEAQKRNFQLAMIDYFNPSNAKLLKWLDSSHDWHLACLDDNSALFLKNPDGEFDHLIESGMKESMNLEKVSPRGAYGRGTFLLKIERGEQALPFLRLVRDAYPDSPSVHTAFARACLNRENWMEAGIAVREALRLGGEKAPLLLMGAYIYSVDGKWDESIEAAEEALRFDPGLWGGYEILGDAYLATDREEEALGAYRKEAELRSDSELAVKLADLYFNRKDYASAAYWYEKVAPDYPAYPRSRVYLAGSYAHLKEYPRSRDLYRAASEKFPGYSQICFFNLARISLREGKEGECRIWLEKIDDPRLREKMESDDSLSRVIHDN